MSDGLRTRRPYTSPPEDEGDECAEVLDPQEQAAVVDDFVEQATESSKLFKKLVLVLQSILLSLLLLVPRPSLLPQAAPYLIFAAVLPSTLHLSLRLAAVPSSITRTDYLLTAPGAVASLFVLSSALNWEQKLLYGLAAFSPLLSLLVQYDAYRTLQEAEELRSLMYAAPEA